jgi:hypothetical protein
MTPTPVNWIEITAVSLTDLIAAGGPVPKVASQPRCQIRCIGGCSVRVQLTGEELANIVGSQLRNIDSAPIEFLSQQPTRNTNPVIARPGRQSIHIAQVFVVAVQFLSDACRE